MKINIMKLKFAALLLLISVGAFSQNKIVLTAPRLDTSSLSNRINLKANTNLNNVNGVLSSTYGGAGPVSGILKANGSGVVSAAVAGTDYVVPSALSGYLPLSGGTLTGGLSGTTARFSGNLGVGGQKVLTLEKANGFGETNFYQYYNSSSDYGINIALGVSTSTDGRAGIILRSNTSGDGTVAITTSQVERFTISSTGAANFSSSVTASSIIRAGGTSAQYLMADGSTSTAGAATSGVYLPVAANVSNTSSIAIDTAQWMRVGDVVTVSGRISFINTLNSPSQISITLPVATIVSSVRNVAGVANENIAMKGAIIRGRTGTNDALLEVDGLNSSTYTMYYTYTYRIL